MIPVDEDRREQLPVDDSRGVGSLMIPVDEERSSSR